jgi:murein DD-endopeptidase MepM/ murein hydrolase activator NlpD
MRGWLGILLTALLVGTGVFAWTRFEGAAPEIRAPESILVGAGSFPVVIELADSGAGLREVSVVLAHALGEKTLHSEQFPGSTLGGAARGEAPAHIEVVIDGAKLPRQVEQAFLRIFVRDWSWRDGLRGNQTQLDVSVSVDRKPPRIAAATGLTYVRRGGTGVVVYSLSEPTRRDGVQVGETFFRGFPLGERRVVFYAIPTDAPADPTIRLLAEDAAGNVGKARWPVVLNERALPQANVTLPRRFLDEKVVELARAEGIEAPNVQQAFHRINTQVRQRNEQQIREIVADSAPERLWQGAFEQLRNSKVTSRFAEQRTYFIDGKKISEATHFGYDLASTAAAPITAAAAGRVAFAGELGIYGDCVILDHGLGVASLYGHLSRLDVAPGNRVERGQPLGLSGATGLAGGDHLHFAILVGGTYVDPLEWWDPKWVRDNIDARLAAASPDYS